MSCSTCHEPKAGGAVASSKINLHQVVMNGANPETFGSLRPPTNSYASFSPPFRIAPFPGGGNFWNGRSIGYEGNEIGNHTTVIDPSIIPYGDAYNYLEKYLGPTADQALNPFPNHVEQNISELDVCKHVASTKYEELYEEVFGEVIDCGPDYVVSYQRIALALAAWQASKDNNSFSSKLDKALLKARKTCEKKGDCPAVPTFPLKGLTKRENKGHDLFYANCASFCHNSGPAFGPNGNKTDWEEELYTGHGFFNIGTPANTEIPGFPSNISKGLYDHTLEIGHEGRYKIPTMRNVNKRPHKRFVKAYTHNGWFKSLKSLVHFYNTRDIKPECPGLYTEKQALQHDCWPRPEIEANVTTALGVGDMGLTANEEDAIVAYLKTLTDSHTPKRPKRYKPSNRRRAAK